MSTLKEQLRTDLTAAMKARDELVRTTLRSALTAIGNAEVSGDAAKELSDSEVRSVLTKETKRRAESAEAFAGAGRTEQAERERAEGEVLARYLPTQLSDDEVDALAADAVAQVAAETGETPGMKQMGQVMKKANAAAAGQAEGGRVAAAVKKALSS
ncbi:GatB/YqeY domain-containing protein [Pseudonocardia phyllosphaerae]|uniref:GatB/YqeY domain-containing protein n=1 Tax=Pseudonocardia phyllosphaerae TaxID=3390502 RepID=UPI003978F914